MKKNGVKKQLFAATIFVAIIIGLFIDTTMATPKNDSFYESLTLLDKVLTRIHNRYVEPVEADKLVRHAIDGALEILDPHTTFFEPKDYEELMVHTQGQFGGLGIQISMRDKILTVMTPIGGTPAERAGIRSGDKIIKISGKSTKKMTLDKAVSYMRGEPGTDITISIAREGEPDLIEFTITRAIIDIKSVPYAGIFNDTIGYVRLNTFSQDAGEKVGGAVDSLLKLGIKGLVFDLRFNPGGLLSQAKEVGEIFLDPKSLVVFTQGRIKAQNQDLISSNREPLYPKDFPLVVMVNRASASAAEIVSGAVQDWDRGVVLGDTTYGKGSVQTVEQIDKERHIKLTTAFYYTPSGRCINRPENGVQGDIQDSIELAESDTNMVNDSTNDSSTIASNDSTKTDSAKVFYTLKKHRPVFGGGGIIPDTIIERTPEPFSVQKLIIKDMFFKYVNHIAPSLSKQGVVIDTNYIVTDEFVSKFYTYLDSIDFDYETAAQKKLDEFKVYTRFKADTSMDSVTLDYLAANLNKTDSVKVLNAISEIESILKGNQISELKNEESVIKKNLKNALLVHEIGQDNAIMHRRKLMDDEQLEAALNILADKKLYNSLLELKK